MRLQDIYDYVLVSEDGCWLWQRSKDSKGYGAVYVPHRMSAHRASYELTFGPVPKGKSVCHTCDNPACINPDHLWLGSHAENMADMKAKGRSSKPPVHTGDKHWRSKYPEKVAKGEAVTNAKMTNEKVIKLRLDYVAGVPKQELVSRYGCTQSSISDYIGGRSWKHLLGENGCPTLKQLKAEAARRVRNSRYSSL